MKYINYTLKGKDVPAWLAGKVIRIKQAEGDADIGVGPTSVFRSIAARNEKANDGVAIAVQGLLRTKSAKKDKDGQYTATVEDLQEFADGYVYDVRAEGTPREVKPETRAARAAKNTGNRIFERAAKDEKFRAQMIRNDLLDEAEFTEWLAGQATEGNGTPAPAATATA